MKSLRISTAVLFMLVSSMFAASPVLAQASVAPSQRYCLNAYVKGTVTPISGGVKCPPPIVPAT